MFKNHRLKYLFALFYPLPPPIVSADLDPDTLNLKSQGKYVTCYLEVADPLSAEYIDPLSVEITKINDVPLGNPIPIAQEPAGKSGKAKPKFSIGDYDGDGIPDLMVKFDRQALIEVLPVSEQVKITIQGSFDGMSFAAEAFIRTIQPGKIMAMAGGNYHNPHNASAHVPSGALGGDLEIIIVKLSACRKEKKQKKEESAKNKNIKTLGSTFEFGPEGTEFSKPVVIILPYNLEELPNNVSEDALQIAYCNSDTSSLKP